MRILSFIAFVLIGIASAFPQSPHGKDLKIDCVNCHESESWKVIPKNIKFNHNKETKFQLLGQHASVSCESCHKSFIFSNVQSACNSCHKDIHQGTLGVNCERCHSQNSWIVSNIIQMHQNTRFPLTGVHINVDCQSCHSQYLNFYFPPLQVSCISCHSKEFYSTTAPNHVSSGFSTECQDCHGITDPTWNAQNFNHSFFPLSGGHNIANCFACHTMGSNFKGLSTSCYSCHSSTYAGASNPNHIALNFSHDCTQCHSTLNWTNSTFNHNQTSFPLTGAHTNVACASCHTTGYTITSILCYSCHQSNYQSTTNPSHVALALPTDCSTCHTTNPGWTNATFSVHNNFYVLSGAHTTLSCTQCHTGNYNAAPTSCYGCHQTDYNSTTNPPHQSSGYPTDCTQCHTQTAWTPSTFNHDSYFPISSGTHSGITCNQCHITPSNAAIFSCTNSCHSQSNTDSHHTDVSGYVYSPTSCYSCHKNGSGGG